MKFEIILVSCKDLRNDSLLVLFNLEFSKAHITSIMKTVCDIKIGPIFAIIMACRETAFMLPFIQLPSIKSYWPNGNIPWRAPHYSLRKGVGAMYHDGGSLILNIKFVYTELCVNQRFRKFFLVSEMI